MKTYQVIVAGQQRMHLTLGILRHLQAVGATHSRQPVAMSRFLRWT
jgi:hypothetical protein